MSVPLVLHGGNCGEGGEPANVRGMVKRASIAGKIVAAKLQRIVVEVISLFNGATRSLYWL